VQLNKYMDIAAVKTCNHFVDTYCLW